MISMGIWMYITTDSKNQGFLKLGFSLLMVVALCYFYWPAIELAKQVEQIIK
jgi:hypothetical protein